MADFQKVLTQSLIAQYPDDNTDKEVELWAKGKEYDGIGRHVLLQWVNREIPPTSLAMQIVHLSGQAGNYAYHSNMVKLRNTNTLTINTIIPLGSFTRAQRDQIQALASAVVFYKTSTRNGCRAWMRDLLVAMVEVGLITRQKFNEIDQVVPLVMRKTEA